MPPAFKEHSLALFLSVGGASVSMAKLCFRQFILQPLIK